MRGCPEPDVNPRVWRFGACINLDGWPVSSFVEVNGLSLPHLLIEDFRDVTDEELQSWDGTIDISWPSWTST